MGYKVISNGCCAQERHSLIKKLRQPHWGVTMSPQLAQHSRITASLLESARRMSTSRRKCQKKWVSLTEPRRTVRWGKEQGAVPKKSCIKQETEWNYTRGVKGQSSPSLAEKAHSKQLEQGTGHACHTSLAPLSCLQRPRPGFPEGQQVKNRVWSGAVAWIKFRIRTLEIEHPFYPRILTGIFEKQSNVHSSARTHRGLKLNFCAF